MKKINLLDTTLRDGSYAINFSFTSADTAILCKELEAARVEYIEVGHGVGLNASNCDQGKSMQTDEEYMIAAKQSLKTSKYGMFCIPGIARLEDIDLAAKHGMDFIRIGTNVTEVEKSKEFIEKAKTYGMMVMANYMKSYALPPKKFAEKVKLSESYGADVVYIVDSSGGMFAEDIAGYIHETKEKSNILLGFHGHNNLGLAISNNIEAIKQGIDFIDTSLQGLGRSSGNAATETMIAILQKQNLDNKIDFIKILEIGNKYIKPLVTNKGQAPLDVVAGFADFHSSYMHFIQKYSAKYNVSPILLIIEICKINKVDIDENALDHIARTINKDEDYYLGKYNFNKYFGEEQNEKHN